jgi:DNA-binding GntR family transcriptional regulator
MKSLAVVERPTGVDLARNSIRTSILRGEFGSSGKLTLSDIADRLGTSVTPIREALRDLAAEGLVDIDPHKGARVHDPSTAELRETYALRVILEAKAMSEAALLPLTVRIAACDQADRLADQMETEPDVPVWAELNRAFHAEIAVALKSEWPRLYTLIETLRNFSLLPVTSALNREATLMRQADREHRLLIEAIRRGDSAEAGSITEKHLRRTRQVLLQENS